MDNIIKFPKQRREQECVSDFCTSYDEAMDDAARMAGMAFYSTEKSDCWRIEQAEKALMIVTSIAMGMGRIADEIQEIIEEIKNGE